MYDEKDKKFLKALKDQGVGPDEAFARLNAVKGSQPQSPQQQANPIVQGAMEFGAGAVAQAPQTAANIGGFGFDIMKSIPGSPLGFVDSVQQNLQKATNPTAVPQSVSDQVKSGGKTGKNWLKESFNKAGVNTDSLAGQAGGIATELAATLYGAGLGAKAGKSIVNGGAQLAKNLPVSSAGKVSQIASAAKSKLPQFLAESLGGTQGAVAATEGRYAKPEELATGLGIDAAIGGVGKLAQKLAKSGLSKIPQFTPSVKGELGQKGMKRVGELMFDNVDNLPIRGGREAIGKAMEPLKKKAYSVVSSNIDDAVKAGAKGSTIDDLMDGVKKSIISDKGAARAGLSLDEVPKAVKEIDAMKTFYKDLYGDGVLNLNQIQQLKKNLRYKKGSGIDALISAKNQFKEGTRKNAQSLIENEVGRVMGDGAKKAVKDSNVDYNILKKLTKTLEKKAPYSGYLTDVVSGSAGAASSLAQGNIGDAIKNAATAIGLKKLATASTPKVIFAKIVKKASNKQVNKFISILSKYASRRNDSPNK